MRTVAASRAASGKQWSRIERVGGRIATVSARAPLSGAGQENAGLAAGCAHGKGDMPDAAPVTRDGAARGHFEHAPCGEVALAAPELIVPGRVGHRGKEPRPA